MGKSISERIKELFSKDRINYCDGHCVEMALALNKILKGSKILVGERYYQRDGEEYVTPISHAVVEYKNKTYDSGGEDAINRWEVVYENPYDCGGDTDVSFNWEEMTPNELKELAKKERLTMPKINEKLIKRISKRLEIALEKTGNRDKKWDRDM
jgi:hypothetical protein